MDSHVSTVYRCKRCSITIRQAGQRLPHLQWHGMPDKNVDTHFDEVEELATAASTAAADTVPVKKSGPSYLALILSAGVLAVIGVVYLMAK